jgi:hypothetical protein
MLKPIAWTILAILAAGCVTPAASVTPASSPATSTAAAQAEPPQIIKWTGHIVQGQLDYFGHDQPFEQFIFPVQQAGFLLNITPAPKAIEVRVDWKDAKGASFMLHPHYDLGDAANGTTMYNGYLSPMYTQSPGCIRIPDNEMAAGVWPMMVHPGQTTVDVTFTITVAVFDAHAAILPQLHGHRADGKYYIYDHHVEPCRVLSNSTAPGTDSASAAALAAPLGVDSREVGPFSP